jgi:hypothetical protein
MMRALILWSLLVGCAGPSQSVKKTDATLLVDCEVASASVYVDDDFAGRAAEVGRVGVRVPHGMLRVEVRADGYFPAYREVTVERGQRARISVPLRAIPEGEPSS